MTVVDSENARGNKVRLQKMAIPLDICNISVKILWVVSMLDSHLIAGNRETEPECC
jgi:hypothetical protein